MRRLVILRVKSIIFAGICRSTLAK